MTLQIKQNVTSGFGIAMITLAIVHSLQAQERSNIQLLESLSRNLKTASASEIRLAVVEVEEALNRLRKELSEQAIGVILNNELQIDRLASELQKDLPDATFLNRMERSLRRILPGRVQRTTDELRAKVANLAKLLSLTPAGLDMARQSIATIRDHLQNEQLRQTRIGDSELRQAFVELVSRHPSVLDIATLGTSIAGANYSSLIKKEFLTSMSQRSFELPIHLRECKDGTSVGGDGKMHIALSLELPTSNGEIRMIVNATGTGKIDVSADRKRIHACAQLSTQIQGQQSLHIRPSQISGDSPVINAHLSTQLTQVKMDGLLGRLRLSEKVVSRAIQSRLEANDKSVSDQIERTVQKRVEDEGYDLAYRINGLIQHGVWDRIHSLDFQPDVQLQNNLQGIRSDTHVVSRNQLGALSKRPDIPADTVKNLDLITWVHESAVNNIFDLFTGIRLSEDTIRGLWETELKLTCDDWKTLQPARIPSVITLADQSSLELRFIPQGVEVRLRVTSCEVDGRVEDTGTRELGLRYHIENGAHGAQFFRQSLEFPNELSAEKRAIWTKTLDLFFGKTIRPMPKFRNASFSPFLQLGYLNISEGWLVVGAARSLPATGPLESFTKEVSR